MCSVQFHNFCLCGSQCFVAIDSREKDVAIANNKIDDKEHEGKVEATGLGIREEILCENDDNPEEKDETTNEEVPVEEATKDVGIVTKDEETPKQKRLPFK